MFVFVLATAACTRLGVYACLCYRGGLVLIHICLQAIAFVSWQPLLVFLPAPGAIPLVFSDRILCFSAVYHQRRHHPSLSFVFFFSYFSTLSPSGLRLADRASCSRHRRRLLAELVNLLALRLLVSSGLLYPAFWFLCAASHVHRFIHPSIALSPCIIHLSSPAFHLARPVHASATYSPT